MLTITKRFEFCYGHKLPEHHSKCKRFHGHNAILEVTVKQGLHSPAHPYPSMIMDFKELKEMVEPLLEKLDHHNMNEVLPPEFLPPTCENMTRWFLDELTKLLGTDEYGDQILQRIRLTETPDSWAEWAKGSGYSDDE